MKDDSHDPIEPHGWFRWLHDQSSWRCQGRRFFPEEIPAGRLESLAPSAMGLHSWELGYLGRLDLLEKNWGSLTPRQRGLALGGASEKESNWAWILARLPECKPGAVETCEIACNALSAGNQRALAAVLEASGDLVGHVPRYDSMNWKAGRFSKTLSQLSCRCIDLVLEAALLRNNPAGVRLALKLGASPDIPIWLLERSFSEKHCALSFCIKKRFRSCMSALLAAGANPVGIPFCTPDLPLFEAISTRQDALAIRLLKMGAALRGGGDHQKKAPHLPPAADDFFGHFDDDLEWANEVIGPLIPFVRVEEKSCFYNGNGQGGYWQTFLDAIGGDVRRLKRFERHGLDSRLSAEEFLTIFKAGHYEKLLYLMSRQPATTRAKVFFRVRRRNISFGEQGPLALRPQDDRINEASGFEPGNQEPCQLPDGSTIHADLSAIAPPDHRLGPCLPGHFWLRTESSVRCRRGKETVMRKIAHTWKMTAFPQNTYQLLKVLPAVRLVGGRFIRLGVTVGALGWLAGEKRLQAAINSWTESEGMKSIAAAAFRLIRAQDQTNRRLPEPVLSEEELDGQALIPPQISPPMKTAEICPTGSIALPRERYLNSRPPTDVPADPPPKPPEDEGGDHKPDPRPFDAFWFGTYGGPLGMEQLETCDCKGWVEEMTEWVRSNGWNFYDRYPHRFYVGKRDPGTKKEIDLPRRDFFRIVAKFKEMNEKYGFCLSGLMIYDKEPSAKPRGSCIECFTNGQHVHGESIGRPLRARLPHRKRRHQPGGPFFCQFRLLYRHLKGHQVQRHKPVLHRLLVASRKNKEEWNLKLKGQRFYDEGVTELIKYPIYSMCVMPRMKTNAVRAIAKNLSSGQIGRLPRLSVGSKN